MRELNYTDNIERDLGMWPSADESPYLYHFYVYTHMTDISGLDLFDKNDLMKVFSERRRYSYYIPRNLDPENLSKSGSTSDIKLSAATVEIRECVISKLRSKFNSQTLSSLNEQLFSDDKCSLPAKDTTVLRTILEDLNQTENVREWFSKPPKPDYPKKLYELETILYDKENRALRNYFYIPLIRGTCLYGYLVLVFKEIQKDEINYIVKYLRESVVSKGISFYDRIVKKRYESSHAIKPWLCESISELANCYGMIAIESSEGIPTFRFIKCSDSSSTTDVLKKEKLKKIDFDLFGHTFSLKFELGELGDEFCGINRKLERELKALPFKLNTFRRAIKMLKDDSAYRQKACAYALHSAVGSIMSRNGSHNIGSHVLAALSHNVGTMPDDRVLYQYIQQRMDYIATVTTDFPTWTQPTMFVADMMKTFLSQRHLLNHIVESEGLKGFQFQNPNMTDEEWCSQKNCVKIHIRKMTSSSSCKKYDELIKYDSKERYASVDLKCDVALAIPGGIVGEHAFFTILENIIRNAAKHSWASLASGEKESYKNLELYIDFAEKADIVEFEVYARLPLKGMHDNFPLLERAVVESWVKKFERPEGLNHKEQVKFDMMPLHHRQQIMLARPFINSQGLLRRENWGLAEMKISAGYLAGSTIEDIGGVGDNNDSIIHPCILSENKKRYFGYKFSIKKPKEILIVVKDEREKSKWAGEGNKNRENGIFVKTVDEVKQEKRLNYRYVVHYNAVEFFDRNTKESKNGILIPFRVISGKASQWLSPFIATIDFEKLREIFNEGEKTDVEKLVYKSYLLHICKERKVTHKKIGLLVAANENEKAGGNSLISDADILELMMEQNFSVCTDQYEAISHVANHREVFELLQSIRYSSNDERKVQKFKNLSGRTIRELIAQRLYDWMLNVGIAKDVKAHLKGKYFVSERSDSAKDKRSFKECVNAMTRSHAIDDFIRYVELIFENTKKLFKQYEEKIVTLPPGFSPAKEDFDNLNVQMGGRDIGIQMAWSVGQIEAEDTKRKCNWIAYRRHDCTLPQENSLYVEPLSGTQTYLSEFTKARDDLGLQMRLVENGLMRILVLDERVAKFLREHMSEVGAHYKAMNINVVDNEWVDAVNANNRTSAPNGFSGAFNSSVKEALRKYVDTNGKRTLKRLNNIDILIVHQGILDKWYPEFKNHEGMRMLLDGLKCLVKYVVVTTGRGTPENIPEEAHLLPFAVVESTLFKKYPEKLILTDTIMNVLPVGHKNATGGQI